MIDLNNIRLIDLVPTNLRDDPNVKAAAESIDQQAREVTQLIPDISIIRNIDTLPERWVDQLAWQFHVDFYDPTLPLAQKRELVKNSLRWHKKKGTPAAVRELVTAVFGSGEVQEWWEYGGDPYHFRVFTADEEADGAKAQEFIRAVDSVKNTRSWLDGVIISTHAENSLYIGVAVHMGDIITLETEE